MSVNSLNIPFSEKTNPELPDLSARPTVEPVPTMNPNVKVGWNADKTEYAVPITEENIVAEGGAVAEVDQYNGTASLVYNGQYPGVWVNLPAEITDNQLRIRPQMLILVQRFDMQHRKVMRESYGRVQVHLHQVRQQRHLH